ncbi:MAG: hypothetical protein JXO72_11295 [Vicinamibacteria bacterium]|nr:hypothetical protein [Vicinamibacteria bacterium]
MGRTDRKGRSAGSGLSGAALNARRRSLELSRLHVLTQIESARVDAHRDMLRRALAAVEQDIKKIS